jgi:hypothetical protein
MLDYGPSGIPAYWQPFWFQLYPYMEQQNVVNNANSVNGWDNGNNSKVIQTLLCPADGSHSAGIVTSGAGGWAGTSYAPNYYMFGTQNIYDGTKGQYISQGQYSIGNIQGQRA